MLPADGHQRPGVPCRRSEDAPRGSSGRYTQGVNWGGPRMSQWQNRMGTIRVSAMIVVLVVVGIILLLRH
jgi:hypothetical protein